MTPETQTLQDAETYKTILHVLPAGFAVFETVDGDDGEGDLNLLEANTEFAEILGKTTEDIQGRTLRSILPGLHTWEFDWVKALTAVAQSQETEIIEEYAEGSVRKWLNAQVVSPRTGIVAVIVADVTEERRMKEALALERNNF